MGTIEEFVLRTQAGLPGVARPEVGSQPWVLFLAW